MAARQKGPSKLCMKCNRVLPLGDFYPNREWMAQNYRDAWCKDCVAKFCEDEESLRKYCSYNNRRFSTECWEKARIKAESAVSNIQEYILPKTNAEKREKIFLKTQCKQYFGLMNLKPFYRFIDNLDEQGIYIGDEIPQKAIEDGNILALNDIIDQYCPNLKAYLEAHPDVDRQCKTDEGNYYMFPFVRGDDSLRVSTGLMIRQDWLNDLGLEMPTTIDEWHDVLTAFKTEKGATAPFAFEYTTPSLRNNWPFMSAYNTTAEFYVGDDGKIHYGPAEENYKEFLATMNQWYKEGLLDPDMPTAQLDQVSAKMTSGASGASLGWIGSRMGVWTPAAKETDPNYDLEAAPVPTLNKGETAKMGPMDNVVVNNGGAAITTRCKDIEAAARLLDWAYSDEGHMYYNFGTEGESYTMENGEPVYTDLILNNPDGLPIAQAMSGYIRGNYNGPFVQDVRYAQQYYTMDCQKKAQATWTVPEASEHVLPPITPSSGESEEFSAIMNEINTYRDEMTLKFILGTESLDNFDKFVDTMNQMNLKRAIEIENSALDRYNAR